MEQFECYFLEYTGTYTPFQSGISSPVYRRVDNGALEHVGYGDEHPGIARMKPGAMYFELSYNTLVVRTPGGDWYVDRLSSRSRQPWHRTGTPPHITVTPSIDFKYRDENDNLVQPPEGLRNFHGVLENGILREV